MDYIILIVISAIVFIPMGYFIGLWATLGTDPDEVEQAWDDGFSVGANQNLNVGPSEFDLLIDDLNPVRKDPNHFKSRIGF